MYIPRYFRLEETEALRQLAAEEPFALLTTHDDEGLYATHLPFVYKPDRGLLQAHVARANPHWKRIADNQEALVIFSGSHAYISPRWYPENDSNVPTWNYTAVHVYGKIRAITDPAWLRDLLDDLSAPFETSSDGTVLWQANWQEGSPHEKLLAGIVGIEISITKIEAKAKKIAAHALEASENDIVIENGEFKVTGTDKSIALPMVALAAYTAHNLPDGMEPGLKETAFYDPTNFTFPAGAYICEVEVDASTGKTSFVNFVAADDFGRLINPMVVEGQVHGGLAQGIGQALLEHAVYNADGQPVTASFMDYTMPRADDLPSFKVSHTTTLCPSNPLGVKGCGEAGAIGASAAVINAITDAIGTNKLEMPASPDRVWHAIHG